MLGSCAFYSLTDPRYPVGFHLIMVTLSLMAMGLGGFLRVRPYLVLGFAGLAVDLASLFYRMLAEVDRTMRMTVIGGVVLAIGSSLVIGAIYYKTNRSQIEGIILRLRQKIANWE